jgi:hypothetical protein
VSSVLKVLLRARLPAALVFFVAASFYVSLVSAQDVLKCVGKDGAQLYSNVRCPPGTEAVVVVRDGAQNATSAPQPNRNENPAPRQDEPPVALPVTTPPEPASANPESPAPPAEAEPRLGMSRMEAQAAWGQPVEISHEEQVRGRVDTWSYGGSRSLEFENGVLSAIHK